jgi:hypothetical protein
VFTRSAPRGREDVVEPIKKCFWDIHVKFIAKLTRLITQYDNWESPKAAWHRYK